MSHFQLELERQDSSNLLSIIGSIIWNSLLVYLRIQLGRNWKNIEGNTLYIWILLQLLQFAYLYSGLYTIMEKLRGSEDKIGKIRII